MSAPRAWARSCDEVDDLAALFVLDALGAEEAAEVRAHLADHPERHASIGEMAGVTPFLAESVPPIAPPPELRARVLGAVAATPQEVPAVPPAVVPAPAGPPPAPISLDEARRGRQRPRGILAAAVLVIVVLGAWALVLQQQQSEALGRLALLSRAVAAAGQPGAAVAPLAGSESAAGAAGFAVFPADGDGYIVLTGLPAAGDGRTWQAWTLADGQPASAGLMTPDADGLAVLADVAPVPGTSVVALTVEPAGGSEAPTTQPVVVGQLEAPLALGGGPVALRP